MASPVKVNEEVDPVKEDFADLLTCSICLETFKQPKYLPCLHTFCETCINTYIVSTVKDAMAWCTVCEEAYCDTCEANHKTFKVTLNHKIVPIKDINEDTSISNICASVACDEHPDKLIEIYCKDHSHPCCTICATVHHRKCEQVITIDKAVSGVKESTKAQELTKKLKETSHKLEEIIQNRNQNTTNFENEIDGILVEIANARKTLNEKLDQLENEIREEVISARKVNILRLSEESTELSGLKSTFDHWKTMFEACLSQGSEIQCLVKMEEIYRKIPQYEDDLTKVIQGIKDISPLTLVRTLNTSVQMWGLCCVDDEYMIVNNNYIYWLNAQTGAIIKEFPIGTGSSIRFVTCYRKSEYMYWDGQLTVKFESAPRKNFQYNHSNLSNSFNQEIDGEGNIYVVGYCSNNIHQLTPTGELIRIIPVSDIDNTVTNPWVMRFKRKTNQFLLTFHESAGPVLVCEID
ncbi:tripartite motif-containing protein 2-like [Mytilus trossulus]|uniref:tripartite motif-containing protein 2-like n=1 Tax=Mytilus trossulus TaxID=6551 RepID=UPI003005AE5F